MCWTCEKFINKDKSSPKDWWLVRLSLAEYISGHLNYGFDGSCKRNAMFWAILWRNADTCEKIDVIS